MMSKHKTVEELQAQIDGMLATKYIIFEEYIRLSEEVWKQALVDGDSQFAGMMEFSTLYAEQFLQKVKKLEEKQGGT